MKVHGFHRGVRRGYVGRAHCGKIVRCVTTHFDAVDCLKCMAAVLGTKLAKATLAVRLERQRARTNAMLAKAAAELSSPLDTMNTPP
jgi:hypothetical protein